MQALAGDRGSYAAPFLDGLSGRFVGLGAAIAAAGIVLLVAASRMATTAPVPGASPSPISLLLRPVPAGTPTMRPADVPAPPAAAFPPRA